MHRIVSHQFGATGHRDNFPGLCVCDWGAREAGDGVCYLWRGDSAYKGRTEDDGVCPTLRLLFGRPKITRVGKQILK